MTQVTRRRVRVHGITQGVGFRPFVWRLADRLGLSGWVQNDSSGLLCEVQGPPASVEQFVEALRNEPPALARIDSIAASELNFNASETGFAIRSSEGHEGLSNPVTQDVATCEACLRELLDRADRRYRYPFINCTDCGPRFTIVEDVPYDRPATTMKSFRMCERCQAEYDDPADRRFHAQPNACPDCGPTVWFVTSEHAAIGAAGPSDSDVQAGDALSRFAEAVREGRVAAVKGIGGLHLVCDASNPAAVALLRERKGRGDKPFAVMTSGVEQARRFAVVGEDERALLASKERPIVLLRKLKATRHERLLESVAPGNQFVGVLLPYSPLHRLMVEEVSPLVVTSGNVADEPIARTNREASERLSGLADCFLFHNREIHTVCDDSVARCDGERLLPIRRSRGYAPMPVRLPDSGPSVLAVGGEIKATFCETKDNYAYLSQHIGDVGNLETLEALDRNVRHFLGLFRVQPEAVVGDLHPGYLSSQWGQSLAAELGVPYLPMQHHEAHAASLIAEQPTDKAQPLIACCFDGTGYGTDDAIWGGEFIIADGGRFRRAAHLKYFPLPGGDACIKRPYRAALAMLQREGLPWDERLPSVSASPEIERRLLWRQLEANLNCVESSSMGRLFDTVASLIGVRQSVAYEAQAAMEMEALAAEAIDDRAGEPYTFAYETSDPLEVCWAPVLRAVCDDVFAGVERGVIAARFHESVARMVLSTCERLRQQTGIETVGLTGGVFQNALLSGLTEAQLTESGFTVLTHTQVPPNDGGLALGQALMARHALMGSASQAESSDADA